MVPDTGAAIGEPGVKLPKLTVEPAVIESEMYC
jgi:hypothetical protein